MEPKTKESRQRSNIGNTPAYPTTVTDDSSTCYFGMSYRQWLIGMALQGCIAAGADALMAGIDAINAADEVLRHLELEKKA
jgi:hypothetical protein